MKLKSLHQFLLPPSNNILRTWRQNSQVTSWKRSSMLCVCHLQPTVVTMFPVGAGSILLFIHRHVLLSQQITPYYWPHLLYVHTLVSHRIFRCCFCFCHQHPLWHCSFDSVLCMAVYIACVVQSFLVSWLILIICPPSVQIVQYTVLCMHMYVCAEAWKSSPLLLSVPSSVDITKLLLLSPLPPANRAACQIVKYAVRYLL